MSGERSNCYWTTEKLNPEETTPIPMNLYIVEAVATTKKPSLPSLRMIGVPSDAKLKSISLIIPHHNEKI